MRVGSRHEKFFDGRWQPTKLNHRLPSSGITTSLTRSARATRARSRRTHS